jgi:ABC-type uncharacterized transport system involved in gliding motility auxiliary subunit
MTPAIAPNADRETPIPAAERAASFSSGRRWGARAESIVAGVLAVYCVVVFNVIVFRHPARIDLTEEGLFTLSPDTLVKLRALEEEIRVIVAFEMQPNNPQHAANARVFQMALDLLKEYSAAQPLVRLEASVNVFQEPDRWKKLCEENDLSPTQWNRMYFIAGRGNAFRIALAPTDLADINPPRDSTAAAPLGGFRGEHAMTGAIIKATRREKKKIYFVEGHGELSLRAVRADAARALGAVRGDLESSGFDALELSLARQGAVPPDAAMVVIAGPTQPFATNEIEILERYLIEDGRLFVALASERTGLEDLLERWGVKVGQGTLVQRFAVPGQTVEREWVVVSRVHGGHPITAPFVDVVFDVVLMSPRPLRIASGQRTHASEPLLMTAADEAGARTSLAGVANPELDAREDKGSFVVAAAVAPEKLDRPPPGWVARRARLVVTSSSNFLRDGGSAAHVPNGYQSASHRDFFLNCVFWLSGQDELLSSGGRLSRARKIPRLDAEGKWLLLATTVLIFPGVFALLGFTVYLSRRS